GGDGDGDGVGGGVEVRGGGAWRSGNRGDDGDDGGFGVEAAGGGGVDVVAEVAAGGRRRRVEARGRVDLIDPVMGINFGIGGKSPPEKFSGGGEWPAVVAGGGGGGRIMGEGERESLRCVCMYVVEMNKML
ncbi:hypothetical protein Tco_1470896, partial [Tanacetum coccineum]